MPNHQAGPEAEPVDPLQRLQDKLHITQAMAEELLSREVICPVRGEDGELRRADLGTFLAMDHVGDQTDTFLDNAARAHEEGYSPEDAVDRGLFELMFPKKRDEVRPAPDESLRQVQPAAEAEKK